MAELGGVLVTAAALGITHAIEPDHVAGISTLTSEHGDSRLSALVGVCFSLGHVALVVLWLVLAALISQRASFGSTMDAFGTLGAGALLAALGIAMTVSGLRAITQDGSDSDQTPEHSHVHLPIPGLHHGGEHTAREYLRSGLFGALFTLSPPISMLAFISTVLPNHGFSDASLAVGVYTVGITVVMGVIGAGVGAIFGVVDTYDVRVYGTAQAMTGVIVVALAVSMIRSAIPTLF